MRLVIISLCLLIGKFSYSQDTLYKKEGFCGAVKLRDINVPYGEAAFSSKMSILAGTAIKQFVFDYGQPYKKDKEALVSDNKGEVITFGSIAQVINFFDYNGWDFVSTIEWAGSYIILFRKK